MERIIAPKGMRHDLAVKLVTDPVFAHKWMCHNVTGECPDGCDSMGNPHRVRYYQAIEIER